VSFQVRKRAVTSSRDAIKELIFLVLGTEGVDVGCVVVLSPVAVGVGGVAHFFSVRTIQWCTEYADDLACPSDGASSVAAVRVSQVFCSEQNTDAVVIFNKC